MSSSTDPSANEADFKFIMKCIESYPGKFVPDFEEVATQTGKKDRTAARLHLNGILRKWGISQARNGSAANTSETNVVGSATPKRSGKSKQTAGSTKKRTRETTGSAAQEDDDTKAEPNTPCTKKQKVKADEGANADGDQEQN